MKLHKIHDSQNLNTTLTEIWDFFCDLKNINKMTPPDMRFEILGSPKIHEGQIVSYRIEIFPKIHINWISEIKGIIHKRHYAQFIDEQKCGPYKIWHHRHSFEAIGTGTRVNNHIHYITPYGLLGEFTNHLFIKKRLTAALQFQKNYLAKKFSPQPQDSTPVPLKKNK